MKEIMYRMIVLMSMIMPSIALLYAILSNECVMMSSFALGALVSMAGHRVVNKNPLEEERNSSGLFWVALFVLPIWAVRTFEPAIMMLLQYYIAICIIAIIGCLTAYAVAFLKKKKA